MDLDDIKNNPEQIKLIINILQSLLPNEDTTKKIKKTKPKAKIQKQNNIRSKTRSPKHDSSAHNRFLTMGVKDLHKEDILVDKALNKFPPTPRNRSFQPISVVCRSCGKKESVNPVLISDSVDRYKCNNCSTNAG